MAEFKVICTNAKGDLQNYLEEGKEYVVVLETNICYFLRQPENEDKWPWNRPPRYMKERFKRV